MTLEPIAAPREVCVECGFDATRWSRQDAIRSVEKAGWLAGLAVERMPSEVWMRRPDPSMWAIGEYVDHLAEVLAAHRFVVELSLEAPGTDLGDIPRPPFPGEPPELDLVETLQRLERRAKRHGTLLRSIDDELWGNSVIGDGDLLSLDWSLRHTCHEIMHHLGDIARLRHRLGDVVSPMQGSVASLHAGDGGVPKPAIPVADVTVGGLVGDHQAARQFHGRPWQDLCLWSVDVVDAWAKAGHPIFPGAAGENLALGGLDWARLRAGILIEIGTMTARISAPAVPCNKNSRWFSDGDHRRLGHDVSPGGARWYAGVLTPGRIRPGDVVVLRSTS